MRTAPTILALSLVASLVLVGPSAAERSTGGDPGRTVAIAPASLPPAPSGLSPSGTVVPPTSVPVPVGALVVAPGGADDHPGTAAQPLASINAAVDRVPDGGVIVLREGTYRDHFQSSRNAGPGIISKSLTLQAFPGEEPWLDGTDVVPSSRWRRSPAGWTLPWSTPEFCAGGYYDRPLDEQLREPNEGPCSHFDMAGTPAHPVANDPQMVFVNGFPLRQVPVGGRLDRSSFAYDWKNREIVLAFQPRDEVVEVSRRATALNFGDGLEVTIRGVGFRRFASNEYSNRTGAAVYAGSSTVVIESSVFSQNAAGAVALSQPRPGSAVRRTVFADNGYTALGANGGSMRGRRNDLVVEGNVFVRNNAEGFGEECTVSCGQAAAKFAHMRGLTLSRNLVASTRGDGAGLWCDLQCEDTSYVYNVVRDNPGNGIFHEVSEGGVVAGNLVTGSAHGIAVASAGTKVYHNTLVDNIQGLNVYDDQRSRGVDGWDDVGPDTRGVELVNNVVVGDGYSLKASAAVENPEPPNTDVGELFGRLAANTFSQGNGPAPVFAYWRDRNGREAVFRDHEAFRAVAGPDPGSQWLIGEPGAVLVDPGARDYRVREHGPAFAGAAPLPPEVAAALDLPPGPAGRTRGAFAPS